MERLQVALAFDTESVYDILDTIDSSMKFVVIDTITPLLSPNLSAVSSEVCSRSCNDGYVCPSVTFNRSDI